MVSIDTGFGHVKVYTSKGKFKFPTWISRKTQGNYEVEVVEYDGAEYLVGQDAAYGSGKIEIADFEMLVKYLPVIVKYVKQKTGEDSTVIGFAPKHYLRYKESKDIQDKVNKITDMVLMQGVGVLIDTEDLINADEGEDILIIDIGFNTTDVLLVSMQEDKWKKKIIDSIERSGVSRTVDLLKDILPSEFALFKNRSSSQLIRAFEKKVITFEGDKIDISQYVEIAKERYREELLSTLKDRYGDWILTVDKIVMAGGGAYHISKIRNDVIVPQEPEFSNARGYYKFATK